MTYPKYVERARRNLLSYFRYRRLPAPEVQVQKLRGLGLYRVTVRTRAWRTLRHSHRIQIAESAAFRTLTEAERIRLFVRVEVVW